MKNKILIYLLVFTSLICLYLMVSSNKLLKKQEEVLNRLEIENTELKDSLQQKQLELFDMQYFSLENNDDALAYYENHTMDNLSRYIADKLLETNEQKGDNPLVPYEGMENPFKINKIKILNHRWIVTDFSDGKYWGELLIEYELKDDTSVDFTLIDHLLYSRSN